jgi:hypothetical protein
MDVVGVALSGMNVTKHHICFTWSCSFITIHERYRQTDGPTDGNWRAAYLVPTSVLSALGDRSIKQPFSINLTQPSAKINLKSSRKPCHQNTA